MSGAFSIAWGSVIKKTLQASEQQRADVRQARELWMGRRKRFFNKALARLIFIDETSTNTKLTKRTGWAPKGERFRTHAPFGKWQTQTFIAGLRCHGLVAPWIVNAPMNAAIFQHYIETQLAPELSPGDVVILDNVGFHKNERAAQLVRQRGAWLLFLPPYSPDLNPIEQTFAKIKHWMRHAQKRTIEDTWRHLGTLVGTIKPHECANYFNNAGYASVKT
jgi:transposase